VGAGLIRSGAGGFEELDRFEVVGLCGVVVADERAAAGLEAKCPVGAAESRALHQRHHRCFRPFEITETDGGLDQLDEGRSQRKGRSRVAGALSAFHGIFVESPTVMRRGSSDVVPDADEGALFLLVDPPKGLLMGLRQGV
jgi:hypothetical protein